ncbi:MAG: alcohol dehydrogenase catalytic domain-containing protein [Proteobacteria bacterium]|nr:alcohol dehydrogenase catalytic domain-containing protein [Pseudomonadota bacterium]
MKAIVKTNTGFGVEILDLEKPTVGETDILIKISAGSLCGSDVHVYEGTAGYEWVPRPIVLGHEFAGQVADVGDRIRGLSVGDRVTALPAMPCGECDFCRMGNAKACRNTYVLGLTKNGAFAEYMLIKGGAEVLKIPDNVSDETASLSEPLAVTLNGIDLSGIKPGQTAAVLGPGPIGLLTVQLLKAAGAGRIVVTGTSADAGRLDIAKRLGADVLIDVEKEDPVESVKGRIGHLDLVFEATGIPATISQGLQMVRRGGKVMVIGIHADDAHFSPIDLVRSSKSLIGVYGYDRNTFQRCLSLMSSGKIDIDPIITHRLPFSRGIAGFEKAVDKTAAKVVFVAED